MPPPDPSSLLSDLLRIGGIWRNLKGCDVVPALMRITGRLEGIRSEQRKRLEKQIETGFLHWSPLGEGIAMPHLRLEESSENNSGLLALLLLSEPFPLPVPGPDNEPIRYLLYFISPSSEIHIQIVSQLSSHLIHGLLKKLLAEGAPEEKFLAALEEDPRPGKKGISPFFKQKPDADR